jgi:hypothetical protein
MLGFFGGFEICKESRAKVRNFDRWAREKAFDRNNNGGFF